MQRGTSRRHAVALLGAAALMLAAPAAAIAGPQDELEGGLDEAQEEFEGQDFEGQDFEGQDVEGDLDDGEDGVEGQQLDEEQLEDQAPESDGSPEPRDGVEAQDQVTDTTTADEHADNPLQEGCYEIADGFEEGGAPEEMVEGLRELCAALGDDGNGEDEATEPEDDDFGGDDVEGDGFDDDSEPAADQGGSLPTTGAGLAALALGLGLVGSGGAFLRRGRTLMGG
jgi:hypothetical protein